MNVRSEEYIGMNGIDIQNVDNFEYLGAYVLKQVGSTVDLNNRIAKARTVFITLKIIMELKQHQ